MPTPRRSLTEAELRAHLRAHAFRPGRADLVGAEVELTPLAIVNGRSDIRAGQARTDALWAELAVGGDAKSIPWRGGALSREPGGQLECSGPPLPTPEAAAFETTTAVRSLRALAIRREFDLLAIGVHPWASPEAIGLHRPTPRYRAMQRYFDAIGIQGRRMMRQTGSVHLAVDFGGPAELRERWELSQRLATVLAAIFANSAVWAGRPGSAMESLRGFAWGSLDPARTGIPPRFLDDPESDPIDQYLDFALAAPVMFVIQPDGRHEVPDHSRPFASYMKEGLPGGFPNLDDWAVHLSTLFPNVRPQGYLEIRTVDAPGAAWVGVPILLAAHALRDTRARRELLSVLRPLHENLNEGCPSSMSERSDATLRDAAEALFQAVRPLLRGEAEALVGAYWERYTSRRMTPGSELRAMIPKGVRLGPMDLLGLEHDRAVSSSQPRVSVGAFG